MFEVLKCSQSQKKQKIDKKVNKTLNKKTVKPFFISSYKVNNTGWDGNIAVGVKCPCCGVFTLYYIITYL